MRGRIKSQGDQWVLRHTNFDQHNHPLTPNPFSLQPYISRRPGSVEAITIAKTHQGVLLYSKSKEVLKGIGLRIEPKQYYNLIRSERSHELLPREEALLLLYYLES
jgi:hypothetical protein